MSEPPTPQQTEIQRRADESGRLVLRGIKLHFVLAVIKLGGGVLGHSYALIADGIESSLDIISSILVWGGLRVAAQPPDEEHPYGHGKAEALAGLSVAGTIFAAAAMLGWRSIEMIVTPHRVPHWFTLPLLVGVVVAKEFFSRNLMRKQKVLKSSALRAEAWHHRSDAITSAAAFVGIAIAVVGGKGFESADDWAALIACGFIIFNGIKITRSAMGEMMDTVAAPELETSVRAVAASVPGVLGLEKCRVRKSGLSHLVDIHVEVDGSLSVREGHAIAHAVKEALLSSSLSVSDVLVHIEPNG